MKDKLRIACVQLLAHPLDQAEEGLTHALEMVDRAAAARPDLMVLPECTYPAYYLCGWPSRRASLRPTPEVLELFADKAKRYACYLAVGIAEEAPDGKVYNAAFLLDPEGRPMGNARKQFLWHFDSRWFSPGEAFEPVATPWGPVGMFICADARLPEIPRVLALKGARLFIDLTNLVSTGRDRTRLTNPQVEYMLKARAIENQAWIAVANKVGMEEKGIVYCGRSLTVSPQGDVVAQGSSDSPEIVLADIPLPFEEPGAVDDVFRPLEGRRPDTYGDLVRPLSRLPVATSIAEAVVPEDRLPAVATLQLDLSEATERLLPELERHLRNLAVQGVDVVVLPESPAEGWSVQRSNAFGSLLRRVTAEVNMAVVLAGDETDGDKRYRTAFFVEEGDAKAKYRKVHLSAAEKAAYSPGKGTYCVVHTRHGNFGIMLGYEGLLPEVARILALEGADVILWPCSFKVNRQDWFARTRAAENRVFVAASNAVGEHGIGESLIVDPRGAILAQAFSGREQAIATLLPVTEARCKAIVPGTDAVRGRQPSSYHSLVE